MSEKRFELTKVDWANIKHYIERNEVILFVGAGTSSEAGLPLLKDIPQKLKKLDYRFKEIKNYENPQHFFSLVEYKIGRIELVRRLESLLNSEDRNLETHQIIAKYFNTIYTTNYDTLLEDAFQSQGKKPVVVVENTDIPRIETGRPVVVKLHGCINRTPQKLVLTRWDYNQVEERIKDTLNFFRAQIMNQLIIFVGFSFKDFYIEHEIFKIYEALKGFQPKIYFIAPDIDKNPEIFDWINRGIFEMGNYKASEFFRKLDEVMEKVSLRTSVSTQADIVKYYRKECSKKFRTFRLLAFKKDVEMDKLPQCILTEKIEKEERRFYEEERQYDEEDFDKEKFHKEELRKTKPAELFGDNNNYQIIGGAGCGKTTVLQYLFYQATKTDNIVPFYIDLKTVTKLPEDNLQERKNTMQQIVEDSIITIIGAHNFAETFYENLEGKDCLILIDSLDETLFTTNDISFSLNFIEKDIFSRARCRFICASRFEYNISKIDFKTVTIQGLDKEERENLFDLLPEEISSNENLLNDVENYVNQEILCIPLLFPFIVHYRNKCKEPHQLDNTTSLYMYICDEMFQYEKFYRGVELKNVQKAKEALKEIAYYMMVETFCEEIYEDRLIELEEKVRHLITSTFLVPSRFKTYRFIHRSFGEFFAGWKIADDIYKSSTEDTFTIHYFVNCCVNIKFLKSNILPFSHGILSLHQQYSSELRYAIKRFFLNLDNIPETFKFDVLNLKCRCLGELIVSQNIRDIVEAEVRRVIEVLEIAVLSYRIDLYKYIHFLGNLKNEGLEKLSRIAKDESSDRSNRIHAISVLSRISPAKAEEILDKWAKDESLALGIRIYAIRELSKISPSKAKEILVACAKDKSLDRWTRINIIGELSKISPSKLEDIRAEEILFECAKDESLDVGA